MNIQFRADASSKIGSGHIRRCLTLAEAIKRHGPHKIQFISDLNGTEHLIGNINKLGIDLKNPSHNNFPENTDWLIIDSYDIDKKWEKQKSDITDKIFVIDDLANRQHHCHLLLDQNFYSDANTRYQKLVPKQCKLLLGPQYSLLRNEFLTFKNCTNRDINKLNKLLVNFGGTDPAGMTLKTLNLIKGFKFEINVVVGKGVPSLDQIKKLCEAHENMNLHIQTSEMARLIYEADLAIAANGTSTWERCCLGLPTISISIADNQVDLSNHLHKLGGCFYVGKHTDKDIGDKILNQLNLCRENPNLLQEQSNIIKKLTDGNGANKIAGIICG